MNFLYAILIALSISLPTNANAGLIGSTLIANWEYKPFGFSESYSSVVVSGVEYDYSWVIGTYLDVGDNYIEIRTPITYNGLGEGVTWTFSSPDYNGIIGVTVSTNFKYWSDSFLSFTNNSVKVVIDDFIRFEAGQGFFRINVETLASTVPEPGNFATLFAGLGLLGIAVHRNKKRCE